MVQRLWAVRYARLAFFGVLFFYAQNASAALLYFDPDGADVYRGDTLTVSLRLDTDEDECINTASGVVHYDPSIVAIDVSRGNSILNLWVEEPKIDPVAHTIAFAGGLPGGYCGRIPGDPSLTNTLFQIVFQSPGLQIGGGADSASARVWIESPEVLLHDGQATPAAVRVQESMINLLPTSGGAPKDAWREAVLADTEPPADFTVTLTKDETAFSGKYFISFNTSDKQSGIDHFEVMEEPFKDFALFRWGRADAPWHITESPYVLEDQTLNSTILVKALDKAGNERVVRLVPDEALRGISHGMFVAVVGLAALIIIAGAIAAYIVWRRREGTQQPV
jgi:hypothetical protein